MKYHIKSDSSLLSQLRNALAGACGPDLASRIPAALALPENVSGDVLKHNPSYIAAVTEAASDISNTETARQFIAYFTQRSPLYSTTRAGGCAAVLEATMLEKFPALSVSFIETQVDPTETNFYAVFIGKLNESEFPELVKTMGGICALKVKVSADDVADGEKSDLTIVEGIPVEPAKEVPTATGDVQDYAPKTQEDYLRVVQDGGVSEVVFTQMVGADGGAYANAGPTHEDGLRSYRDQHGIIWWGDGQLWKPNTDSVNEAFAPVEQKDYLEAVRTLYERTGVVVSPYGTFTVCEHGPRIAVKMGESTRQFDTVLYDVMQLIERVAEDYDLPADIDRVVEVTLIQCLADGGTPIKEQADKDAISAALEQGRSTLLAEAWHVQFTDRDAQIKEAMARRRSMMQMAGMNSARHLPGGSRGKPAKKKPATPLPEWVVIADGKEVEERISAPDQAAAEQEAAKLYGGDAAVRPCRQP